VVESRAQEITAALGLEGNSENHGDTTTTMTTVLTGKQVLMWRLLQAMCCNGGGDLSALDDAPAGLISPHDLMAPPQLSPPDHCITASRFTQLCQPGWGNDIEAVLSAPVFDLVPAAEPGAAVSPTPPVTPFEDSPVFPHRYWLSCSQLTAAGFLSARVQQHATGMSHAVEAAVEAAELCEAAENIIKDEEEVNVMRMEYEDTLDVLDSLKDQGWPPVSQRLLLDTTMECDRRRRKFDMHNRELDRRRKWLREKHVK
jgi:hypothetical protein